MLFCVEEVLGTILVGTGKGNVLSYDLHTGEPLFGYGVMKKGGCRLMAVSEDRTRLVCAGEDESGTLLRFK